jgi:oligopeptide/dipeptide ABC transporter ATP-binding protein
MLLEVLDLRTYFYTLAGVVKAVDGVSLAVGDSEIVGLVGESGCGKSMTAFSIMRVIPPPGRVVSGKVLYGGKNLPDLSDREMQRIRGGDISMVFQDPMTFLNPVMKVGDQIAEAIQLHQNLKKKEALEKSIKALEEVYIAEPSRVANHYPFQLSGGMRQRVLIAMATSCNPSLIVADEPTTALDVTVQAQILDLLGELRQSKKISLILITHNLGIVAKLCDRVYVMYAGEILESGGVFEIYENPTHPYTRGLIKSVVNIDESKDVFETIPGTVPDLMNPPAGCRFHPRCTFAKSICTKEEPKRVELKPGHSVRCWLYG